MSKDNKYFDEDNVFFAFGHGAEYFDIDIPRYTLLKDEYLALTNLPGDRGITNNFGYFEELFAFKNKIKIPTSKDNYLVKPQTLGISTKFGKKREGGGIEAGVRLVYDQIGEKLKAFGLHVPVQKVQEIDRVKLYHPQENDEELNVLNTIPNLVYQPGTFWINSSFSGSDFQKKHLITEFNIQKGLIIKYKNKLYHNWLRNVNFMTLQKSGLFRKNQPYPFFKKNDIENYDSAFDISSDKFVDLYTDIPAPIVDMNQHAIVIFYPTTCLSTKLGDIIKNKKNDPLSYDFVSWYKAAFKESILTFDDICLLAIVNISLHKKQNRLMEYISFITRDLPYLINSFKVSKMLPSFIKQIFNKLEFITHLKHLPTSQYSNIFERAKLEGKQIKGFHDVELLDLYKKNVVSNLFFELKKTLTHDEIKTMALGLYIDEIINVDTNLEFIYKFINIHGSTTGPVLLLPFICRNPFGQGLGLEYKLWKKQSRWIPKKVLKNIIEERRQLTRPLRHKTRSHTTKSVNKTRKNN